MQIVAKAQREAAMLFIRSQLRDNLYQEEFLYFNTFFFEVPTFFEALPFLITATSTTQPILRRSLLNSTTFTNYRYWHVVHPYLTNDDNKRTSFRAMYRMNLETFEALVNDLSCHPVFQLTAHNALPVHVQISCAIWRLANCHIGYRMINIGWGVSHGSYMNFLRRFMEAMHGVYGRVINWPTDNERVSAIHDGFEWPHGIRPGAIRRLPNVIGALDGKNVVIAAPRVQKEQWRDRNKRFSMKLTAICDNKCRFTYIRVGDSGIV